MSKNSIERVRPWAREGQSPPATKSFGRWMLPIARVRHRAGPRSVRHLVDRAIVLPFIAVPLGLVAVGIGALLWLHRPWRAAGTSAVRFGAVLLAIGLTAAVGLLATHEATLKTKSGNPDDLSDERVAALCPSAFANTPECSACGESRRQNSTWRGPL